AWKNTAAYKMLNETSLGAMIEDITAQVADRALQAGPGAPVSGRELVALLVHLAGKGFAVGVQFNPQPPQPKAAVGVIRDAAKNEVFRRIVGRIPPLNEPAAHRVEQPGGRTVWVTDNPPIRWWYEKDDFVFSFTADPGGDPAGDALDGKTPGALKHPVRAALTRPEPGQVPLGLLFVDLAAMKGAGAMPPLSPQAVQLG